MSGEKKIGGIVVTLALLMIFSGLMTGFSMQQNKGTQFTGYGEKVTIKGFTYTSHAPIRINGDDDFTAANGVIGGSGTKDDPYIISGWDIDAHGAGDAIYIGNTTKYFVVRDCQLHNASSSSWPYFEGAGITLYNVKNGTIENNTIYNNSVFGIFLYSSSSNTPAGNTIDDNSCGIGLYYSSRNKLYGNKLTNNGIFLWGYMNTFTTQDISTNNTVNGKPVYYYKNANMNNASVPLNAGQVILGNVSWLKIENMNIGNASVGIEVGFSSHITVSNDTICNNSGVGLYLYNSDSNTLADNTIYSNENGIFLYSSSSNYITRNRIENNTNYGIYISSGNNNHIYGNILAYNHGSGTSYDSYHIQALDNGINNHWNSTSGHGNFWIDWAENNDTNDQNNDGIVDWPYRIDGSAGAKDYYPLKNRTTITVPLPPQNLQAKAGDGYVNLTWSAPADNGGSAITEYRIYHNGTLIATVPASQLWYNDTDVTPGQTYTYYVTAVNSVGESDKSNDVQTTPGGAVPEFSAMYAVTVVLLVALVILRRRRS